MGRYRKFKRVSLSAKNAKLIIKTLVDPVLEEHVRMVPCTICNYFGPQTDCGCEEGRVRVCDTFCAHQKSLPVARMLESNTTIGKKRAHLDLPDEPDICRWLSEELNISASIAHTVTGTLTSKEIEEFNRVSRIARAWAQRGPLERLAEAADD